MNKFITKALTVLVATVLLVTQFCGIITIDVFALDQSDYGNYGGTIYYVDSVSGLDTNSGTSESAAWKSLDRVNEQMLNPGDQVLFKSGGVWNGRLLPKGSGEDGKPIVIGKYGGDARPILNGASAFYDGFFEGSTILLYNQEYYEIYDLEITNWPDVSMASCFGIWIVAKDYGVADHFVIKDCYFQKIMQNTRTNINNAVKYSSTVDNYVRTDGINGAAVKFSSLVGSEKIPTSFNDVQVLNNEIKDIELTAISLGSDWADHQVAGWIVNQEEMVYSTNIRIANNTIYGTGAAVTLFQVDGSKGNGCIVENNVCWNNDNGHSFWVMWSASTIDLIYRGNEIFGMDQNSGADDGIFDADGQSVGTVFEYNYTHHNAGPVYIPCNIEWDDEDFTQPYVRSCVWRYNISFNDNWRGLRGRGTFFNNGSDNIYFYNNLIATDSYDVKVFDIDVRDIYMYNNIFYNLETYGKGKVSAVWNASGQFDAYVNNNCFYNIDEYISLKHNGGETDVVYTEYSDFADDGIIAKDNFTTDPKINLPNTSSIETTIISQEKVPLRGDNCYKATGDAHHGIANVISSGLFTLKSDSPCIGAGKLMLDNGGLDFFGNAVSETAAPDVGPHQYTSVNKLNETNTTLTISTSNVKTHSFDLSFELSEHESSVYRYLVCLDGKPYMNIQSTQRRTEDHTLWGPVKGTRNIYNDKSLTVEDLDMSTEYNVTLRAYYGLADNEYIESAPVKVTTASLESGKNTLSATDIKVYLYSDGTKTLTLKDTFNANDVMHMEALIVDGNNNPVRGATAHILIEAVGLDNVMYDVAVSGSDGIIRFGTRSQYLPKGEFEYKITIYSIEKEGYTFKSGNNIANVTAKGYKSEYNLNLIKNSNFANLDSSNYPTDWRFIRKEAIKLIKNEGPSGSNVLDIRSSAKVSPTIRQDLSGIPNGTYTLTAWVRNNNTASILTVSRNGKTTKISLPLNEEWTQISIPEVVVNTGIVTIDISTVLTGDYSIFTQICDIEISKNMLYNTEISSIHPIKGMELPANFYYQTEKSVVNVGDVLFGDTTEQDENLKAIKLWYYTGENYKNAVYVNSAEEFEVTMGQYKKDLIPGKYTFSASTLSTGGITGIMRIRDGKTGTITQVPINSSPRYVTTKVTANITSDSAYVEFVFSGEGDISKYISILEMSFANCSDIPSDDVMTVIPGQNLMDSLNGGFEQDGKVTNDIAVGWNLNNYKGYFDAYVVNDDKHSGDFSLKCTLDEKAYHNLAGSQFTQGGVSPNMDFSNLPAGKYTFKVWVKSNVKFKIGVKTQMQTVSYIPWVESTNGRWKEVVVEDIVVTDGTLLITSWFDRGAQSEAIKLNENLVLYAYLDDISLTLNELNVIENGNAEEILNDIPQEWNITETKGFASLINTTEAYSGENAALAVLPGTDSSLTLSCTTTNAEKGEYSLTAFIRGNGVINLNVKSDKLTTPITKQLTATDDWQKVIINGIPIESAVETISLTITNKEGNTSSFVSIDDMKLATPVNSEKIAKTLPSISAIQLGENLKMPEALLDGYTISIDKVSNESVIKLDGTVNTPDANTFVTVTFKVVSDDDPSDIAYASRLVTVYGFE